MTGFKNFILRGNLVDLAVAVIIGTAFGAVVTATFTAWLTDSSASSATADFSNSHRGVSVGAFINAVISFLILAAVVYFLDRAALHRGQGALLPEPRARHPRGHQAAPGDPRPARRAAGLATASTHL